MLPVKLAAYLDEAGEDPRISCASLKATQISYVALRHVWSSNVCLASDQACQLLKGILKEHDLTVVMIASELGQVSVTDLMKIPKSTIDRTFDIASYYGASHVRVFAGLANDAQNNDIEPLLREWLSLITERAISANVIPLLEVTHGAAIYKPVDIAQWMSKFKRWKLLYDPAQLIIKQTQDPFIRYWTLLKQYVGMIDVHDFKIGHGHKPAGYGDAKLQITLDDASKFNFNGWYILEPALGRKHGGATTRTETFRTALDAFEALSNLS